MEIFMKTHIEQRVKDSFARQTMMCAEQ